MESEDDIERSAAFDELLRNHAHPPLDSDALPKHMQTLRLLHEVFRATATDAGLESDFETAVPERVGRFQIVKLLGRGGFGTVYLAEDPLLNRQVALKVIHSHLLLNPPMRLRALREREAMARLQHPNIIPVWEAGEDGDKLFIVSEYCPGKTLAQWLVEHPGPLDGTTVAQWGYRLADAVAHSHHRGVIHRDLKPGNILLDPLSNLPVNETKAIQSFEPRLSDFGLAKILDGTSSGEASMLTQAGLFIGSLDYASPEQVKGQIADIGPRTDVYALGVLLFQLLTGRLPHAAESQYEVARRICEEHAKFPNESAVGVPKDLQAIALRAMARDKSDRYASAEAMRDDLSRFLQGQPVLARPVSLVEQSIRVARKYPAVTALASACCLLALMYFYNLVVTNQQLAQQSRELTGALRLANDQRSEAERQRQLAEDGQRSLNKLLYRESIKSAFDQWHQQNYIGLYDSLRRMQGQHAPTMEWHYLKEQLDSRYHVFDSQDDPVQALAWHPVDNQVVSVSASGRLRWWEPGRKSALRQHQAALGAYSLAIHPNGQTIALPENKPDTNASGNKTSLITFWNSKDARRLGCLSPHYSTTVESLEYSPDGRWLAGGPRYANVIVTEVESQEPFAIKSERRNRQVLFSPESDRIAVYVSVGLIEVHELSSRKLLTTIRNLDDGNLRPIYSMAWMPGQDALVVNAGPDRLQIYSTQDGRRIADAHAGMEAENIAVSPDGQRLVLGDNQGFVRIFDIGALLSGDEEKVALTSHIRVLSGKITDMVFVDAQRFVAADAEGNLIQWTTPTVGPRLEIDAFCEQLHWHDDEHIWIYGRDGVFVHFVDASQEQLKLLNALPPHLDQEVVRTQNASNIAMASMDGKITIVDSRTGAEVCTCQLPTGNAITQHVPVADVLLFSNDGQLLFATGENNHLCAINVKDGTVAWSTHFTNTGYCLAEDVAHNTLFWGGGFEPLMYFEADNGHSRGEHVAGNGAISLLVNSYRNELISGHQDGTVRARSLNLNIPPVIHRISTTGITSLAMTPDNCSLITGDEEGVLRIADADIVPYGVLYRSSLEGPEVSHLRWSPNRQRLAALIYSTKNRKSELVLFDSGLSKDAR